MHSDPSEQFCLISEEKGTIQLHRSKNITIGRENYNDVVLKNLLVSRQHAVILWENASFVIKDLNSQNGTFVNDKSITLTALSDGDKIKIGGFQFRFSKYVTDSDLKNIHRGSFSRQRTMKAKLHGVSINEKGFYGKLSSLPMQDLVQVISQGHKTGQLKLWSEESMWECTVFFEFGEIVHATSLHAKGKDAFFETFDAKEADFSFEDTVVPSERTIEENTMFLLMEAHRLQDEKARDAEQNTKSDE